MALITFWLLKMECWPNTIHDLYWKTARKGSPSHPKVKVKLLNCRDTRETTQNPTNFLPLGFDHLQARGDRAQSFAS